MKFITAVLSILVCISCQNLKETRPTIAADPPAELLIDESILADTALGMPASLRELYSRNGYKSVWLETGKLSAVGDSLLNFLSQAGLYGLLREAYRPDLIRMLLSDSLNANSWKKADVYLSDGFFTMKQHLKSGRLDPGNYGVIHYSGVIDREAIDLLTSGTGRISIREYLEAAQPQNEKYFLLKDSLRSVLLNPSEDSVLIRKKIKLIVNLERCRWKKEFPGRRLEVNIPAFLMRVIEEDSVVLESKVIVGKEETQTPLISSVINYFTVYPYWHVPRSIATKELLPLIQSDSTYLRKHNYDVLDRDGNVVDAAKIKWVDLTEDNFPYVLRQREGNENTLGVIKFNFNNRYGVYLHDTNGRRSFNKSFRALSHGCVRVHKAVELARYLVKDDSIYVTPEDLDQYMEVKQRLKINVPKPLPVFFLYETAELGDGKLILYDDIYKFDEVIYRKLTGEKAPEATKPLL